MKKTMVRRITVRLDDHLLHQAKRYAAECGTTLTAVFAEALREKLERCQAIRHVEQGVKLPTTGGRGPRSGVDLHSSSELADLMDPVRSDRGDSEAHPVDRAYGILRDKLEGRSTDKLVDEMRGPWSRRPLR